MKNRFFKASICLILAIAVIFSSSITFGAASNINYDDKLIVLNETVTLNNNEVIFSAYNITDNYVGCALLENVDAGINIKVKGTECLNGPKTEKTIPNNKYKFYKGLSDGYGGGHTVGFDKSGGIYRKVRVKLSHYYYFNEDGSYTLNDFTYRFRETEYVGRNSYSSVLIIVSGAAITFVAPDKDGYIEFYVSTNIGIGASYYTIYSSIEYTENGSTSSSGNGVNGGIMNEFMKGCVRTDSISIVDVTEIQLHISKKIQLHPLQQYNADVDNNESISILDATKIQLFLANRLS